MPSEIGSPSHDTAARSNDDESAATRPVAVGLPSPTGESFAVTARKVLQKCNVHDRDPQPREFAVGEQFPFLGDPRTVVTSKSRDSHVVLNDKLVLAAPRGPGVIDVRDALADLYRAAAQEYCGRRIDRLADRVGVDPPDVVLFDSPTRLVGCDPEPPVRVNWRAIMAPPQVVEHALVHGLVHGMESSHGEAFERTVERHRPAFEYDRWLDSMGIALALPP